ncbi:MAG: response regulator [Spirochaetota bacterium]|nr:response regulator [Spirochaetota bacterium]
MSRETVLIVDDEESILKLVKYNLVNEGYRVIAVTSGEEALSRAFDVKPELIVLDLMLPGLNGIEVCKLLARDERTSLIPVLMLTARSEDADIIAGLEAGADDYITKPFSPKILVARIKTIFRRKINNDKHSVETDKISIHKININLKKHEVVSEGELIDLSVTEFTILEFLCKNPGWVFSRNQIISAVKGDDYPVTERSVDVQILGIRKKLKSQGQFLETVRGIGYRMAED